MTKTYWGTYEMDAAIGVIYCDSTGCQCHFDRWQLQPVGPHFVCVACFSIMYDYIILILLNLPIEVRAIAKMEIRE